jgi:wyosine [tRNA(Phe)-imidazoG37] synthetase (radical SAM superfamily)
MLEDLKTNIVFGPINSRRFGYSLGVDLSPNIKQCNFDCLYCELGEKSKRNQVLKQNNSIPTTLIIEDIKRGLEKFKEVDVLTFTANGEPTLYEDLGKLIREVKVLLKDYKVKTLILSNSGNISEPKIRETLLEFDKVKLSLDCANAECLQKLDRPAKGITIEYIKSGIQKFSEEFKGELYLETLFVEGINDNIDEVKELNSFFAKLKSLKRIDLGTIERPPTYKVKPISYMKIFELSQIFYKYLPIMIVRHQDKNDKKISVTKSDILEIISRRPLTHYDIVSLFDSESVENFQTLLVEGLLKSEKVGNTEFYKSI